MAQPRPSLARGVPASTPSTFCEGNTWRSTIALWLEAMGEAGAVDAGYRRANEHGFTTRANICRFVALMFACGERFDVEERWAVGILTGAPGMDETLKSQWLGDAGIRSSER